MGDDKHPATEDRIQTQGRKDNAARPLNAAPDNAGAERYPATKRDDSVEALGEPRTFDPRNPKPRQGAGDGGPPASAGENRLGR